jgi:hypothetical protein
MDANIIVGSAILALALAIGGFLAAAVLAANEGEQARSGRTQYPPKRENGLLRAGASPLAEDPAQCYYECMNSFRWTTDWDSLCGEACGTGARLLKG